NILNTDDVITATITDNDANIKAAEYFVDVIGVAGEGRVMNPVDDDFDSPTEDVTAPLSIADLSEGQHTVYIHGQNVSGKWGKFVSLNFIVDRIAPTIENVHIVYPEDQTAAHNGQWIIISALIKEATTQLDSTSLLLRSALVDANSASGYIMVDNGEKGDAVSNDGIFTARLKVTTTETDTFTFTIDAADIVPNNRQITGKVVIDNIKPSISISVLPVLVNGEIYVPEVLVEGSYYDIPDSSGVRQIILEVKNAETDNINTSPVIIPPNTEREFARNVRLVEGQNTIHAEITDRAGNVGEDFIILTYINPAYTEYVDGEGGTVQSPDGTTVEIPPGALLSEQAITINTVNTDDLPDPLKGISLMKTAHQFGPEGLVFHKPVTITLIYNHLDLDVDQDMVDDFDESRLQVYYLDGNEWIRNTADARDDINNTVTFTTNHFSIYALGNDDREAAFKFYWTQNPFNPDDGTTAVIELSEPGEITLNIYDLSGNLVRTLIENEPVSFSTERRWDGLNDFDRFVGSGIYIYVFEFTDELGDKTIIKKPIGIVK
ncbi:MAG: choice-of-anchor X domain-containing protein, partial [bacterium]